MKITKVESGSFAGINNLNQIIDDPNLSKKYDRVVIDTVTQLYDEFLIEASGGKTPSLNTRGAVNNVFANLLRSLRSSGIKEIICLAQEKIILPSEDWSPDDDEEDAVASVTIHLPAGASNTLCVMSDVIGRLYIAHVNEKNVRRLWVSPTPGIVAGARSQHYREKPPYLVKPTISRLNKLLGWTD